VDLNGDGFDDVISGQYSPAVINLWMGSKEGFDKGSLLPEAGFQYATDIEAIDSQDANKTAMMATANFADWDSDGDYDMIVGDVTGGISLSINEGTTKEPKFGPRVGLKIGDKPMRGAGKTDPMAIDWDGDGLLDILAGTEAGDVFFFRRLADGDFAPAVSALSGKSRSTSYREVNAALKDEGFDFGYRLRITVNDWNEDGQLDLLIGNCFSDEEERTSGKVFVMLRQAGPSPATTGAEVSLDALRQDMHNLEPVVSDQKPAAFNAVLVVDEGDPNAGLILVRGKVAKGWHLYASLPENSPYQLTELSLEMPEGIQAEGGWVLPASQPKKVGSKMRYWTGDLIFSQRIHSATPIVASEIKALVDFQVCDEQMCFPPTQVELPLGLSKNI
jgi:hypothetical protein